MADEGTILLDIDILQPNPLQPRGLITSESLVELVDSLRAHGILEPLVIAKTPAGYQIIAGERRWRAARIAGLTKVPVVIRETSPQGMLEMAIVENAQRVDLNPLERSQAFKRLIDEFGLTTGEIAQRVGKSPSYVSNTLRLLTLPDVLKDGLLSGATTEGHARALAMLEDPLLILEGYKIVLKENLSVRGAEEIARRIKAREGFDVQVAQDGPRARTKPIISVALDDLQHDLTESVKRQVAALGITPKIKLKQSRVETRIEITLRGEQDATSQYLDQFKNMMLGVA